MQQEQDCTSIGKNIVFTSSTETTYFVVFLIASGEGWFSYCLQVSGDPRPELTVFRLPLRSPNIHVAPRKLPLDIPYAAQKKSFPLDIFKTPSGKDISLHATHQMRLIVSQPEPHSSYVALGGSGIRASDATHALLRVFLGHLGIARPFPFRINSGRPWIR